MRRCNNSLSDELRRVVLVINELIFLVIMPNSIRSRCDEQSSTRRRAEAAVAIATSLPRLSILSGRLTDFCTGYESDTGPIECVASPTSGNLVKNASSSEASSLLEQLLTPGLYFFVFAFGFLGSWGFGVVGGGARIGAWRGRDEDGACDGSIEEHEHEEPSNTVRGHH